MSCTGLGICGKIDVDMRKLFRNPGAPRPMRRLVFIVTAAILLLGTQAVARAGEAAVANRNLAAVVTSTPQDDGSIEHIIQAGETLWTVAAIYGVDLNELLALNGYADTPILQEGDVILVQPANTPTATDPPPATPSATAVPPTATSSATPSPTHPPPTATPRIQIDLSPQRPASALLIGTGAVLLLLGVLLAFRSRRMP